MALNKRVDHATVPPASGTAPKGGRHQGLLNFAILVVLVLTLKIGLDLLLDTGPARAATQQLSNWWQQRSDPTLGAVLDLGSVVDLSSAINLKKEGSSGDLVCVISDCTSCSANRLLGSLSELRKKYPGLRCWFIGRDRKGLELLARSRIPDLRLGWDENDTFSRRGNAYFLPRIYLLDTGGRLLYLQKDPLSLESVFADVERSLAARAGNPAK